MKSIRTKIVTVFSVAIVFIVLALLAVSIWGISTMNERDSNQILEHIGRENANVIDSRLENIEHSVGNVYYYAYDQLESLFGNLYSTSFRTEYLEKVGQLAVSEAKGNGYARMVYYRLTNIIREEPMGFFFEHIGDEKYKALELTDISKYSPDDIEHVGWYYMPKDLKSGCWIGPYNNANYNRRVITYAEPIYVYGRFAGVIGMDIDVSVVCEELSDITVYNTGSAVMFDIEENIFYEKELL